MRKLSKFMALVLVCGLMAGCGNTSQEAPEKTAEPEAAQETEKADDASEEAEEETEEEAPQEAAGETVNINWYVNTSAENPDKPAVEAAMNEYMEPLIGVTVSIITAKEEPEIALALASGEDIDLYWTASWANGNNYIRENSCLDLTDYLQDYPDLYGSIPENIWKAAQKGGRNYFVPVYKEAANGCGLVYPVATAEEYGWDMSQVKEFADLEPMLKEAYENGATNALLPQGSLWDIYAMDEFALTGTPNAGTILGIRISEGTTVENLIESTEFEEFVSLMYGWNQAGYINPERVDNEHFSFDDMGKMMTEKDAVFATWTSVPDNTASASLRYGVPVETVLDTKNYLSANGTFGSAYMVNARTEKMDACLKFLGLLSTDQTLADLFCYGIEGEHYTRDAEGYVTIDKDSDAGWRNSVWASCNVMAPSLQAGESADKKEQYDIFNKNAETSIIADFDFDRTNVDAECAAVDAVCQEYFYLLTAGFYNPEEYLPKFQKALKDAGIDSIIAEMQEQYDAYRS